jgi:hypothetical protein
MNDSEMQIAIAEACGYKPDPEEGLWYQLSGGQIAGFKDGSVLPLPNYPNDLNAMHQAEKVLTYEQFDEYYVQLAMKMVRPFHATAAQRAESLLKTLNLWKP